MAVSARSAPDPRGSLIVTEEPRSYDRSFTTLVNRDVRRRVGISTEQGQVVRFVVQLEYRVASDWRVVVRFDHDPASAVAHDVTDEGIHMDVYRNGEKWRSEEVFPPMFPGEALTYAEEHLRNHYQRYVRRFERWHGIKHR